MPRVLKNLLISTTGLKRVCSRSTRAIWGKGGIWWDKRYFSVILADGRMHANPVFSVNGGTQTDTRTHSWQLAVLNTLSHSVSLFHSPSLSKASEMNTKPPAQVRWAFIRKWSRLWVQFALTDNVAKRPKINNSHMSRSLQQRKW